MRRLRAERRVGLLAGGAVLLALVAVGATVALPATDAALRETSDAERRFGRLEQRGMEVYRSEGCWYCHTQQTRRTRADAAYGRPLSPGDYGDQSPAMLGYTRTGPDLTHVGSRYSDASELVRLLRRPRAGDRRSTMPSYAYLSDEDLEALAAYLLSLR